MPKVRIATTSEERDEIQRNAEIVAEKLHGKGVIVSEDDSPDELVNLLESVEAFEDAVRRAGGDLMMDEPPEGRSPQPDDERFVLPLRRADENVASYIGRIAEAERRVRG